MTTATIRIGVSFDGFVTTGEAIALSQRAVEAGASSLWVAEHLGYREAIATCVALALKTPRAMLVPTAVSPYLWHPTPTAMAMATLDEVAPGRAAIAIGTGNPLFLQESGRAVEKPVRAMREFAEALRKLWTGEAVHLDGEFVKLAGARLAFRPSAAISIYIAAIGPDMLRLAGRIGDGVALSAGLSTDSVRQSIALCAEGAGKAGRDPATLRRAGYLFFGASHDSREARDAVRQKLASNIPIGQEAVIAAIARRDIAGAAALVPDEAVEAFGIAGTPEHCTKRLRDFIDAGLDEPVLGLLGSPKNCLLALDVMRQFVA